VTGLFFPPGGKIQKVLTLLWDPLWMVLSDHFEALPAEIQKYSSLPQTSGITSIP